MNRLSSIGVVFVIVCLVVYYAPIVISTLMVIVSESNNAGWIFTLLFIVWGIFFASIKGKVVHKKVMSRDVTLYAPKSWSRARRCTR
jgi:uncharacterized membrane protein